MNQPNIIYNISSVDLKSAISDILDNLIHTNVLAPYQYRIVSSSAACEILGISLRTLYRYIEQGKIEPLEHTHKSKYSFSLKYLLELNIKVLRSRNYL